MSHVDIKERPCRPVEFKGQGSLGAVAERRWGQVPLAGLCNMGAYRFDGSC